MQNNLDVLDRCITDLVRKFLIEDKNDTKAQLRDVLEERIANFLSLAADDDKFFFPETPFILLQSTSTLKKFTAHGASIAWNAIFQYATNLMAQPWRKEFYTIRMFSGYYQHNVEHNLSEAWRLLAKIGYERKENKLVLSPPLDPDAVVEVARDALVAFVECQMIQSIWEGLHKRGAAYNWIQLLEYRKLNICSVQNAISALNAEYRRRLHQNIHCHDHYDPRHIALSQPPIYGQRYMECYGIPRYGTYNMPAPMIHPLISYNNCNMAPNLYAVAPHPVNVPTAQLIEVEPPPMALGPAMIPAHPQASVLGPAYSQHPAVQPAVSPMASTTRPLHSPSSATPRMENGFVNSKSSLYATVDKSRHWDSGTQSHRNQQQAAQPPTEPQSDSSGMENWDYVYSGLENQGYNKDVGERGDLLRTSGGAGDRVSDSLQRIHIEDRESSEVDGRASVYDNVPSPAKVRNPAQNEPGSNFWKCGHCTYHNKLELSVCEMCGRSRNPGPEERPLATGGPQCPKCTLVNKKDATKCDACDAELKDSPTYV